MDQTCSGSIKNCSRPLYLFVGKIFLPWRGNVKWTRAISRKREIKEDVRKKVERKGERGKRGARGIMVSGRVRSPV